MGGSDRRVQKDTSYHVLSQQDDRFAVQDDWAIFQDEDMDDCQADDSYEILRFKGGLPSVAQVLKMSSFTLLKGILSYKIRIGRLLMTRMFFGVIV